MSPSSTRLPIPTITTHPYHRYPHLYISYSLVVFSCASSNSETPYHSQFAPTCPLLPLTRILSPTRILCLSFFFFFFLDVFLFFSWNVCSIETYRERFLLLLTSLATATAKETCAAGSNETSLATSGSVAGDGRGRTNVLVVTTTKGVVNGVHGHTTDTGPAVALRLELVVGTAGLEEGLVNAATAGNETNHGAASGGEDLLGARGELDAGLASVGVVCNDGGVVARRTGDAAAVAGLLLNVADDGTLGEDANGEDVSDGEGS